MSNRRRKHPHKWVALKTEVVPVATSHTHFRSLRAWWEACKKDRLKSFVRHPHHYAVAFGLSSSLYALGHYGSGEHAAAWIYAVWENITTVLEE